MLKHATSLALLATAGLASANWTLLDAPAPASAQDLGGAMARAQRQFEPLPDGSGYAAPQPFYDFKASVRTDGTAVITPRGKSSISVSLKGVGRPGSLKSVGQVTNAGHGTDNAGYPLVGFDRPNTDDWYVNNASGLQHWMRIDQRPTALLPGNLQVSLGVGGPYAARELSDDAVAFQGTNIHFSGLKAWDATGAELDAWMSVQAGDIILEVDDTAARYPVTIDPTYVETQIINTSTPSDSDVGSELAIDGTTAMMYARESTPGVGSRNGAVYVYELSGGTWTFTQKLIGSDTSTSDLFGGAIALEGDRAVFGADGEDAGGLNFGALYVFERSGGTWSETQKILHSDAAASSGDGLGQEVALSGDTIAASAPGFGTGAVIVFDLVGGTWTQSQILMGSTQSGPTSTGEVVMDGDTIVFDHDEDVDVFVFERSGGTWSETQILASETGGNPVTSPTHGYKLAIDGNTVIIGSELHYNGFLANGAAFVWTKIGGTWTQVQQLIPSDDKNFINFGSSVAVEGEVAIVGAEGWFPVSNGDDESGAAYVFERIGGTWTEQQQIIPSVFTDGPTGTGSPDRFGDDVAISGDNLLIGASAFDAETTNEGVVFAYTTFIPPVLTGLSVDDNTFLYTGQATGTVSLDKAAPAGGTEVTLMATDLGNGYANGQVPASVTVAEGSTTANFAITTSNATQGGSWDFIVTATLDEDSFSETMTVMSPRPKSVGFNPGTAAYGSTVRLTVEINGSAPSGGLTYDLASSDSGLVPVPATLTIPAGQGSAFIDINTGSGYSSRFVDVTVTSQDDGSAKKARVTLSAPTLATMVYSQNPANFGSTVTLTLTSRLPAPEGGFTYSLVSTDPSLVGVPATATISQGSTSVAVNANIGSFYRDRYIDVVATDSQGREKRARLFITAAAGSRS